MSTEAILSLLHYETLSVFYQGEDSCIWRKDLEGTACLQIYWITQVER